MLGRWALRRVLRDPAKPLRASRHIPSNRIHNIAGKRRPCAAQHLVRADLRQRSRSLVTASIPSILVPPLIFVGLLLSLWAWKCFWIILLQDKLLYISWLPPFARSEKIADYEAECRPVRWEEKQLRSLDGTKLAVCEGRIPIPDRVASGAVEDQRMMTATRKRKRSVVLCYFQGNGGSTPMRLPLLSQVLRTTTETATPGSSDEVYYTILALSYRGYWTSSGRATQSGIETDAQAFLDWVSKTYAAPDTDLQIILWGHSLGAAIASTAAASYLPRRGLGQSSFGGTGRPPPPAPIAGLIVEAPTSSIKDMLISLYPQKWLPYRYLWPFSWNNWNIAAAMQRMAHWRDGGKVQQWPSNRQNRSNVPVSSEGGCESPRSLPPVLLLSAEKDEVIPPDVPDQLEQTGKALGLDIERKDVPRAMHIEAPLKMDGRKAIVSFILKATSRGVCIEDK